MRVAVAGGFRLQIFVTTGLAAAISYLVHIRHAAEVDNAYVLGTLDALECFHECWSPLDDWNAQRDLFTWLTTCQRVKRRSHGATTARIANLIDSWPGWQGEW